MASGERAEPGDVIEVDEDTLERLNSPSYDRIDKSAEPAPEPEPDEPDANVPTPDTEPQESTQDEPVATEPVSSASDEEDEADAEAEAEDESEPEPEAEVETPDGAQSEDVGDQTPTPDVPSDDYSLLSKMAKLYEGDEVHGSMSGDEITQFFESLTPTEVNGLKRQAKQELEG
jgi:hypothetical protein